MNRREFIRSAAIVSTTAALPLRASALLAGESPENLKQRLISTHLRYDPTWMREEIRVKWRNQAEHPTEMRYAACFMEQSKIDRLGRDKAIAYYQEELLKELERIIPH
jgi:hypothetical protein